MTYPHCKHCSWWHPAHVERHETRCGNAGCPGNEPMHSEQLTLGDS